MPNDAVLADMAAACEEKFASLADQLGEDEAADVVFGALQSALGEIDSPPDRRSRLFESKLKTILQKGNRNA